MTQEEAIEMLVMAWFNFYVEAKCRVCGGYLVHHFMLPA